MWELICKNCGDLINFKYKHHYNRALKGLKLCRSCVHKGKQLTEEHKLKISEAKKLTWKNKSKVDKQKQLINLSNGRNIRWGDNLNHEKISKKYKGCGNPFFGKLHTESSKLKMRKSTTDRLVKFWKSQNMVGINTKPEKQIQKILKDNQIEFKTPFVLEHKIYDLYLPKYNLIIEVDGCYWHSKNVPISKMNKQQLRRWKNDRFKDNLAIKNGHILLRIWEDEIESNSVLKRIYQYE